jgi:predicted DNA-binding antitoxin AbrB/MazE fold protein
MAEIVTAVYERGMLRPLQSVNLQEHQTVRLQVLPEEPADDVEQVIHALVQAGLLTPPPGHSAVPPLSEEERRQLAHQLGQAPGKPLSQIIIDERGEW